ncbi:hypothetical protein HME9304_03259 [Flagellimonas maritima]|uniref:Uncharacterized protein n=1 Tax=Flagellimonas maritima TaxID=1383885 RepID=A0A2Z4LY33_9FLAO|nr:hypothetical protein HME9304_03259 [Allomuricauda aurantiaca]
MNDLIRADLFDLNKWYIVILSCYAYSNLSVKIQYILYKNPLDLKENSTNFVINC